MWESVYGYCPVRNMECEIQIKFAVMSQVNATEQRRKSCYKCNHAKLPNEICSNCPIFNQA